MARPLRRMLVASVIASLAPPACKNASFSGDSGYRKGAARSQAKDTKKDDFLKNSAFGDKNTDGTTGKGNGASPGVDNNGNAPTFGGGTGGLAGSTTGPATTGGGGTTGGSGRGTAGASGIGGTTGAATGAQPFDVGGLIGGLAGLAGLLGGSGAQSGKAWSPLDQSDWYQYPHKCNGPEANDGAAPMFDHVLTMAECRAECERRGFTNFADCANPGYLSETGGEGAIDPLIIDLGAAGVSLSAPWRGVLFDIRGQGIKDKISWPTAPESAVFLTLAPVDGASMAQSVHSLFGDRTLGPDGQLAADGFAALAKWDLKAFGGNGDGVISKDDAVWPRLRAWRNTARDGVIKDAELVGIGAIGVQKIDVTPVFGRELDIYGNMTGWRSVACLDGCAADDSAGWTKAMVLDVWFHTDRSFAR